MIPVQHQFVSVETVTSILPDPVAVPGSRRRGPAFALAALVGLLATACGDGATEPPDPEPPAPTPNRAPALSGAIPAQTVHVGETATVNVSSYFTDPDGDALSYTAASSDAGVATVTLAGSTLTVTAVAQGAATVTVTARDPGGLSAQQNFTATVPNRAPETLVTVAADTITTGESITVSPPLADWFSDPDGDSLTYLVSSSDDSVAVAGVVDGDLVVEAVAPGTATITVSAVDSGDQSAEVSFEVTVTTVSQEPVVITAVEPEVLIEGEAATIKGMGFSANTTNNNVYIGDLGALVTSASGTSLSIVVPEADCLPPRREELRVAVADESDALAIGVTPVISEEDMQVTDAGEGCVHLPGAASGGEYLIGVVSISEDVASLTPVTLNGTPGDASVVGAARYAAAQGIPPAMLETAAALASRPRRTPTAAPAQDWLPWSARRDSIRTRHARAHLQMSDRDLAMLRESGPVITPTFDEAAARGRRQATVGDTLSLRVHGIWSCTEFETIRAVVRRVSDDLVWLDDIDNPQVIHETALDSLDAFYSENAKGVHANYFGELSDVDQNDGRVLVLMTKEANRGIEQTGAAAWVSPFDLYPQSQCPASNVAELFYILVPDPAGSFGPVLSAEDVFGLYPWLLAHEIVHVIQANYFVFGEVGLDFAWWEVEGTATLAEQLVGYRSYGHASGQDLGRKEIVEDGPGFYSRWFIDMISFFGGGPGGTRVPGAPEQCSWVDDEAAGNTGPCLFGGREAYGVPSMVLRYAMDRWGAEYPGGEQALMQRFMQSPPPHGGFAALVDVSPSSSWSIEEILADFYITLGLEVLEGIDTPGMASWDLYDILGNLRSNLRLQPYTSDSASPRVEASIRAGSSLYFDWTPDGSLSPTSIKVTAPDGSPVPDHISVWAVRIR